MATPNTRFDFVLATGDVAYAGSLRATGWRPDASRRLARPPACLTFTFCVPGNHDIDRERQKMCLPGAAVRSKAGVIGDLLLDDASERKARPADLIPPYEAVLGVEGRAS